MKNNFSILKTLPLTFFLLIFFISALVLYQLKNEPKKGQSIKSQLIGKNIPEILIPEVKYCLLYTSPSPRDATLSRMPSSA